MKSRRERILDTASDIPTMLLYYDRKECESLPVGAIEEALAAGEITVDEIVAPLREALGRCTKDVGPDGKYVR